MKKSIGILFVVQLVLTVLFLIGYVRCVVKAVQCNWEPIGKAEVLYTVGAVTGVGGIIGWFDIEDN